MSSNPRGRATYSTKTTCIYDISHDGHTCRRSSTTSIHTVSSRPSSRKPSTTSEIFNSSNLSDDQSTIDNTLKTYKHPLDPTSINVLPYSIAKSYLIYEDFLKYLADHIHILRNTSENQTAVIFDFFDASYSRFKHWLETLNNHTSIFVTHPKSINVSTFIPFTLTFPFHGPLVSPNKIPRKAIKVFSQHNPPFDLPDGDPQPMGTHMQIHPTPSKMHKLTMILKNEKWRFCTLHTTP